MMKISESLHVMNTPVHYARQKVGRYVFGQKRITYHPSEFCIQRLSEITSEYEDRDPRMDIFFVKPGERFWLFSQPMYNPDWSNPDDPNRGIVYNVDFGFGLKPVIEM